MTRGELESKAGLVGLRNVGNTCYMNAVLQALSNCPPLVEFMRLHYAGAPATCATHAIGGRTVAAEFGALICHLWADYPLPLAVTPVRLLESVRAKQPGFRVFQQQDAQEFLRFLLDKLHEALKRPVFECEVHLLSSQSGSLSRSSSVDSGSYVTCSSSSSCANAKLVPPALMNGFKEDFVVPDEPMDCCERPPAGASLPSPVFNGVQCGAEHVRPPSPLENGNGKPSQRRRMHYCDRKPLLSTSVISEIFGGKLSSCVQCLHCNHVSETTEFFQDLSLPIPSRAQLEELSETVRNGDGGSESVGWLSWLTSYVRQYLSGVDVSLNLCLSLFFSADRLTGDDQYQCSNCNKLRDGVKICRLVELPEILCIHIKRFRYDSTSSRKLNNAVRFPIHGLDLAPYLHKNCVSRVSTYDLIAVITHHGSADGGHYTTFCYNQRNGQWYEFDDETVIGVDPFLVQNAEAYVLFYQKVGDAVGALRVEASDLQMRTEMKSGKFFVSSHWLTRFNTFAEPGPINNFDFLCIHGGILPKRYPNDNEFFCPLSSEVFSFLMDCFGGGPVCDRLRRCSDCEHFMYAISCRRRLEIALLVQLKNSMELTADDDNKSVHVNVICSKWLKRWEEFLCNDTNELPGPMDNSCIMAKVDVDQTAATTKRNQVVLSRRNYIDLWKSNLCCPILGELWQLLLQLYGGGPEIQVDCCFAKTGCSGMLTLLLRRLEVCGSFNADSASAFCKNNVVIAEPD